MTETLPAELPSDLRALLPELMDVMAAGVDAPLGDGRFGELALRVFRIQFEGNPPYRAFCAGRGRTPETVDRWEDVPAVPARAFKHLDLVVGDASAAEAVFRTSGTSAGAAARGRHLVPSLALYRASLLPPFRAHLLPEGEALPLLSLIPSPERAPGSSLSAMVGTVADALADGARWCAGADGAPELDAFVAAAEEVAAADRPALVVGTAFAFVHLLDHLAREGRTLALPEGTRLMETGGFKGRSRSVSREELYEGIRTRLGVPPGRIVNEYGMTELLSQLYDPVLREGGAGPRRHVAPPWLRVRALDPATLAPLPPGEEGLLAFFDLANAGSVSAILTEDVGTVLPDGLRLSGRAPGSEPRGCSLALEEILARAEASA